MSPILSEEEENDQGKNSSSGASSDREGPQPREQKSRTPLDAVTAYIFSGEPFTYADLCGVNLLTGGDEGKDRVADKSIQKWRRKGYIAFTREGRNVVWRLTPNGERFAELRRSLAAYRPQPIPGGLMTSDLADRLEEQIARIIDPEAWLVEVRWDRPEDWRKRQFERLRAPSLAKAREILSLDALRSEGWRPIESAPDDEPWLLLLTRPNAVPFVGCRNTAEPGWTTFNRYYETDTGQEYVPKFWRPLPPPPSSQERG